MESVTVEVVKIWGGAKQRHGQCVYCLCLLFPIDLQWHLLVFCHVILLIRHIDWLTGDRLYLQQPSSQSW